MMSRRANKAHALDGGIELCLISGIRAPAASDAQRSAKP
jgi:hypothetical protein